ncbi:hypothetical protein Pcinc_022537 [Petrolisthes cinctipes]|uniref:Ras-GAP domain-containing protein n=1 Tax=Petrolisthes cinctipes TaxID=88211 RepID=A0AAE1KI50_PETCI|nr:hypothetical protein Pcinc_022537 [Petrolisthes cinctipes]
MEQDGRTRLAKGRKYFARLRQKKTFDLSAFFGEEFQFDIPREFRFLSFYLYERDPPHETDKIMGVKCPSRRMTLHKYHGKDQWFPITPVDADSEVQSGQRGGGQDRENTYNLVEDAPGFQETRVSLWHDSAGVFGNVFLGEVKIPLHDLIQPQEHDAWYFLQPRDTAPGRQQRGDLGTLRLNLHYTSDHVFSSQSYDSLRNLILQSTSVEPITGSVAWLLGEVVPQRQDVVQPLTRVFLHHGQVVPFVSAFARHEISKITDTNTIFRGNTLVSKCIDELMKLVGHHYLRSTLKPTLDLIFRERKPCEIDPTKLQQGESRDINLSNIKEYISVILKAIINSALSCPPVMCQIFSELKELANTYFPNEREVRYSVISGFVFLRFFAPAILHPKLFDLTSEQIDPSTQRTLTLLSKTVQSVGNLVSSRTSHPNFTESYMRRESYMREVFALCVTAKHVEGMRTAMNCVEEKEWLDLLTKVCQYNSHRLKQYHPGAYINSVWVCCRSPSENAPGCSAVSNYLECELKVHIDSDREMERLRSLLMDNISRLEELHAACESVAMFGGGREVRVGGTTVESPPVAYKSLSAVISSVRHLQMEHCNHQRRILRTLRYGSKQAPIGDDNYLLLQSTNNPV